MAKHGKVAAPTDVGERVKRTGLSAAVGAVLALVVILPEVLRVADENLGEHLPPEFRAWMLGAAAVLTVLVMTGTRIMAIPGVNDWLSRWSPFGTVPPQVAKEIHSDEV